MARAATLLRPGKTPGLTIRQLLANTPAAVVNTSAYVGVRALREQRRTPRIDGRTVTEILGERPRIHEQNIHMLERDWTGKIKCSCDCEFFTFVCEVALHRHGAADIIHSNGDFPYTTNPRGVPLVCKHLYVIFRRLQNIPQRRK